MTMQIVCDKCGKVVGEPLTGAYEFQIYRGICNHLITKRHLCLDCMKEYNYWMMKDKLEKEE